MSVLQILNFLAYLKMLFGYSWIFVTAAFSSKSFSSRCLSHNCFSSITNCDLISGAGFEDFTSFNIFLMMIFLSWSNPETLLFYYLFSWNKHFSLIVSIATYRYKFIGVPQNVVGQSLVLRDSFSFGQFDLLKTKISIRVDGGGGGG